MMKRLGFLETKRKPRYSMRKLNVGMASVLLGVTIFGINFTNHSVKAATTESVEKSKQPSTVVLPTAERTNTQKATSATEKVRQGSASNNTTANNPTESATTPQSSPETQGSASKNATANNSTESAATSQSAPKTQGSADTDIRSSTAKSAAKLAFMNLMAMPGTYRNAEGTVGKDNINKQPAKENQDLANETNLTSSDNYSSNIYKGTDGKYYKIVTIYGNDYVYHAADIQASGADIWGYPKQTAADTKNNINISKEDLGNGQTRWTVVFFPHKGLQNVGSKLSGLCNATFGIALTSDYQIVGKVDMEVISDSTQSFVAHTFEPGSSSATDITIQNPSPEVKFSFDPKTDVEPNGLINSGTMPAYNNKYLQGPYYFTTDTDTGKKNLWQTYFEDGKEYYNAADSSPYLGSNHDFHFNTFKIANDTGVDGAGYADSIINDTHGGVNGVFSSDNFTQAMEFKSQGKTGNGNTQFSSYVISFTTQHTDSHEIGLTTGSGNQQFSGISANIYSQQNMGYYNMMSRLYGEQRALDAKDDDKPLIAENIIPNWDAKKAANAAVDAAVVKQKALITNADNLSDGEKRDLNNQVDAAATNAKKAIDAATTNDGATKAGQDGVAAIEKVVPTSLADAKTALTDAINKGKAAQKSASYYNDGNGDDKSALDKALSQAGEDLKKNPLTQATADQDAQAIEKAINGLKGQPTNLDKLNQAISDGTSAQAGSKYANSSADSKGALDQAINAGQTAKTQSGLTQKEADADASAIETAINNLNQGTDATKNKPVIPASKIPVGDHSHLTDDEKNQVKNNVEEANKGKFPAGTKVTVGDDGTATVTYPDGTKDTIPGKDLIIGVKGEGISGNNAEGMNGNTAKSGSKNNSLKTLPQTGTKDVTILEILGLFLSLFGLLGLKKKHREE